MQALKKTTENRRIFAHAQMKECGPPCQDSVDLESINFIGNFKIITRESLASLYTVNTLESI